MTDPRRRTAGAWGRRSPTTSWPGARTTASTTPSDAKYHYYFWRPIHAIQRADTDENPATIADTSWVPLLTVNHPEYPSAHACYTTAVTRELAGFFGDDDVAFSMLSTVTATTHEFDEFSDAAREVFDARIWAGLHFPNSTAVGGQIGRKVARYISANVLTPV
jgi:hypothetical protein